MVPADSCPLVGVSTYRQVTSWWSWERDAALVPGAYLDLVSAAGGQPVLVPPEHGTNHPTRASMRARVDCVVAAFDALVLIGGGDVQATRYGQLADPRGAGSSRARDELELALLDAALDRDLPLLAICRGMQLLNVGLGGDLLQHLPDHLGTTVHQPRPGAFGEVAVTTAERSEVRRVLGEHVAVLCSHHQAVATLGERLVATAWSDDGVVEAVELPGHRFVVGVQWHPEENGDRRLFDALVAAARTPEGTSR
jgi:gamma-glutamyl-gamma-aminobutyrate hydrolase PuuD